MNIEIGSQFYLSLLFGTIGMGYFMYGKKQARFIVLFAGMGLMILPYFLPDTLTLTVVSVGLMSMPFVLR